MQEKTLLPWYKAMITSKGKLLLFVVAVVLCSPIVFLYGALYPLFERYR